MHTAHECHPQSITTSQEAYPRRRFMHLVPTMLIFALAIPPAMAAGSASDGQRDFSRCAGCHATQPGRNGIGPSLDDVVGRQSGSVPGYHYSTAMAGAHITWSDESLDRFLSNPQNVV